MKINAKVKNNRLNVRVRLSFSEKFNEAEMEQLQRKAVMGLLKPQLLRKHLAEYTGPEAISLQERMKKPVTKSEFLLIMAQITEITRKLKNNNMQPMNIQLDMKTVFINETTGELLFLYVPVGSGFVGADFLGFMSALVYAVKPYDERDKTCISDFAFMLRSLDGFEASKIDNYIASIDRSVMEKIKRGAPDKYQSINDKIEVNQDYDPELDLDTGKLDKVDWDFEENTGLLNLGGDGDEDGTTSLEEDSSLGLVRQSTSEKAVLTRIQTGESISINKPVFRIGKERSYVDYFVSNNNAVSRSHADIITRGNRVYIKDLNSKNRTFVNGEPIQAQNEVELFDGDGIKLANEEFTIKLR